MESTSSADGDEIGEMTVNERQYLLSLHNTHATNELYAGTDI
jgi:hypothetical protein